MDGKITSYTDVNNNIIVDFFVDDNGIVPMIFDNQEIEQRAQLSAFLQRDSIPQLIGNDVGVEWTKFLTQDISFSEIDSQIRDNLDYAGVGGAYYPFYSIDSGKLRTDIRGDL